jgi:tRNA G18 (ribose-2'-O)-methylase SpoU
MASGKAKPLPDERASLTPCISLLAPQVRSAFIRLPDLITITASDDPRLADYVQLRDATLRRHLESAGGLFIAEGDKVIRRAVEAGYRPRSFLLADRWLPGLQDVIERWPDIPVYLANESLTEQVTGFHVHRGALASLHRVQRHTVADILRRRRLVILEDIVDHTNVGAILRNAAALGWDGALLSPRTADPLYRRAIKVSMGAVFSLPWARLEAWSTAPEQLAGAGFTTLALTLAPHAIDLDQVTATVQPDQRIAIMLGTEGAGLSSRWTDAATLRATIPMAAGIDSLNVAAASAIACYVLSRRGVTGQSAG